MAKPWKKHLRGSNGSILRGRRSSDAVKPHDGNDQSPTNSTLPEPVASVPPTSSSPARAAYMIEDLEESYQGIEIPEETSEEEAEEEEWKPASAPPPPAVRREQVIPSQFTPRQNPPSEPAAAPPPPVVNKEQAVPSQFSPVRNPPNEPAAAPPAPPPARDVHREVERSHASQEQAHQPTNSSQPLGQDPRQATSGSQFREQHEPPHEPERQVDEKQNHRTTVLFAPDSGIQEKIAAHHIEDDTPETPRPAETESRVPALESELEEANTLQIVEETPKDDPPAYSQAKDVLHTAQVEQEQLDSDVEDFDIIIVGAGISGINMAYRVQEQLKGKSYVIIERRENVGGTWDLMKYPGIRSDSDLHTFGFAWRPWPYESPIAEGPLIVDYLKESAKEYGIDKNIRYRHRVVKASWQSRNQAWTLSVEAMDANGDKSQKLFRGKFMVLGTGYYDYDKPLEAKIPGIENFKGKVVHPQFWPENLDYTDKKVAVIGSGATAVTLIPAMADKVEKITMIQRTPSYIVAVPNRSPKLPWYIRWLIPSFIRRRLLRITFLLVGLYLRKVVSKGGPSIMKRLKEGTIKQLPPHIPYEPHFKPTYKPWEQRMCFCPDGDFYKALRNGKGDVRTGTIKTITASAIEMDNGDKVHADIIVTATGLAMKYGGNASYTIDGEPLDWGSKFLWRGIMVQDVPNAAIVMGYTKNSWTLGADATATMVVRLIKRLDSKRCESATPRVPTEQRDMVRVTTAPGLMGLTSTYIMSALKTLPKSSDMAPWNERGNYWVDIWQAMFASLDKGLQYVQKPGL